MWYSEFDVSLSAWLGQVAALFNRTLGAVLSVPVLRLFLVLLLLMALISFLAALLRQGRKGKL